MLVVVKEVVLVDVGTKGLPVMFGLFGLECLLLLPKLLSTAL